MANKVIGGKKFTLALQALERKIVGRGDLRVGFLEGATYPARTNARFLAAVGSKATPKVQPSMPIAQAAFWNEFGTTTVPSRPFFRTTIAAKSKQWGEKLGNALIATDYNGEAALRMLGQDVADDITRSIAEWDSPPNAELTQRIKGFDKPLVDSGDMQRAVDYEIVTK